MAMLPGWNSLEAVGSIGHSLHMAAMVVLVSRMSMVNCGSGTVICSMVTGKPEVFASVTSCVY